MAYGHTTDDSDVKGFLIKCGSGECSWVCVELPSTVSPFPVYGFRRIDCDRSNVLASSKKANCTTESEFHARELLACQKNKRIKLVRNFND